ncbi:MAG: integrase core domain-containing protein, partial [Planctomycetota bacterium]
VGTTRTPNEAFVLQAARNLLDVTDGVLRTHRALIIDRDAKFSKAFRTLLKRGGVTAVRTPPKSPNCNAYAERFVRSIKEECLGRMIFFDEASLRRALREYAEYFIAEQLHQGVGNRVLQARRGPRCTSLKAVTRVERLGGLLTDYRESAA